MKLQPKPDPTSSEQPTRSSGQGEGPGGPGLEIERSNETQQNQRSSVSPEAKSILRRVKESPNAYPPLKSVAGSLWYILENYEPRGVNGRLIEMLAPRVEVLSQSLSSPNPLNELGEEALEWRLKEVGEVLDSMVTQEDVADFLEDPKNAQELNRQVNDIRTTIMDYQGQYVWY